MNTFMDFLSDKHADQYHGLDDDMPDDFENWVSNLDPQEFIDYAEEWGGKRHEEERCEEMPQMKGTLESLNKLTIKYIKPNKKKK